MTTSRTSPATSTAVADALSRLREATAVEALELEEIVVDAYLPWARSLARRYARRGLDVDDLEQIASLALVGAIRRYRPAKGDFVGFAGVTIRGELKKAFRDQAWTVRPPRRVQELKLRVAAAREVVEQRSGTPTTDEIADALHVGREEVDEVLATSDCFRPDSLDATFAADGATDGERLGVEDPTFALVDEWASLGPVCRDLPDRDREVLGLRFVEGLTQSEIGERIGVSQMQVSRDLGRIVRALRRRVAVDPTPLRRPA